MVLIRCTERDFGTIDKFRCRKGDEVIAIKHLQACAPSDTKVSSFPGGDNDSVQRSAVIGETINGFEIFNWKVLDSPIPSDCVLGEAKGDIGWDEFANLSPTRSSRESSA
jgi:hypothetical protein